MKNVIVFALGRARYAIELRWVREVLTLGYVTPVPTAPPSVGGAVNIRGTVTPVIELESAAGLGDGSDKPPRRGDGALLLELEGVSAALHVSNVETVTTLRAGSRPDLLDDGQGNEIPLIDGPDLMRRAQAQVSAAAREPAVVSGDVDEP